MGRSTLTRAANEEVPAAGKAASTEADLQGRPQAVKGSNVRRRSTGIQEEVPAQMGCRHGG